MLGRFQKSFVCFSTQKIYISPDDVSHHVTNGIGSAYRENNGTVSWIYCDETGEGIILVLEIDSRIRKYSFTTHNANNVVTLNPTMLF